jgi:hypothetical protein
MKKRVKTYTISAVAELYDIHPQTLRLYEREGFAQALALGGQHATL